MSAGGLTSRWMGAVNALAESTETRYGKEVWAGWKTPLPTF